MASSPTKDGTAQTRMTVATPMQRSADSKGGMNMTQSSAGFNDALLATGATIQSCASDSIAAGKPTGLPVHASGNRRLKPPTDFSHLTIMPQASLGETQSLARTSYIKHDTAAVKKDTRKERVTRPIGSLGGMGKVLPEERNDIAVIPPKNNNEVEMAKRQVWSTQRQWGEPQNWRSEKAERIGRDCSGDACRSALAVRNKVIHRTQGREPAPWEKWE